MAKKYNKNNDIEDFIAQIITQDDAHQPRIDLSKLPDGSQNTLSVQNFLSRQGLYVSSNHKYYDDGIAGEITEFGLKVYASGLQRAQDYLNKDAMKDLNLTHNDILKIQIALNSTIENPNNRIAVNGIIDQQTSTTFAKYIATQRDAMNEANYQKLLGSQNTAIFDKMRKHLRPKILEQLGIQRTVTTTFRNAHNHTHTEGLPSVAAPETSIFNNNSSLTLEMPLRGAVYTSAFGERWGKSHQGVDMDITNDTTGDNNIYAAAQGIVAWKGHAGSYGNMVVLYHGEYEGRKIFTYYAHVKNDGQFQSLERGEAVAQGEPIATLSGSGSYSENDYQDHLHFEVVIADNDGSNHVVNPESIIGGHIDLANRSDQDTLIKEASRTVAKGDSRLYAQVLKNNPVV